MGSNTSYVSESGLAAALYGDAQAALRSFAHGGGLDAAASAAFGAGSGTAVASVLDAFAADGWPRLVLLDD